jgi:hypothetical protein
LAIGIPLLVIGLLFVAAGDVFAAPVQVTLEQCANGGANETNQCSIDPGGATGWVTGNSNSQKSTYQIGQFIAYRFIFDNLTPNYYYCGAMSWDVSENGKPAVDYISTFSHTMTLADPTLGTTFVGQRETPTQKVPITADPVLSGTMQLEPFTGEQRPGTVNIWGGVFTTYLNSTKPSYPEIYDNDGSADLADGGAAGAQASEYCFQAHGAQVLISVAGHIAYPANWGNLPRPSGSPYHMRYGSNENFTAPRSSTGSFVGVSSYTPGDPDSWVIDSDSNFGNIEVQLDVAEPTAITLQNMTAADGTAGTGLVIAAIGLLAIGTGLILVLRKRQPVES